MRLVKQKKERPYCWDKDPELNRRLNVVWVNVVEEDKARERGAPNIRNRRYTARHLDKPEGAWVVYDKVEKRNLSRSEVLKLTYAQCCETLDEPVTMQ